MSEEKSVKMCSIGKLLNYNFVIPSYQRGYRWRGENGEVQALLEDIKEFIVNKKGDEKYCLNPIAIKKVLDTEYNLVDGQQRLTTIYLILKYFNDIELNNGDTKRFTLKYETKLNENFLENIKEDTPENVYKSNIDYYHIYNAYVYIKEWIEKNEIDKKDFKDNLLDNVNIIWYNVGEDDENEVFQRLNAGKISLTNSELIKAIFLRYSYQNNSLEDIRKLEQINMANQWENIEIEPDNDDFW